MKWHYSQVGEELLVEDAISGTQVWRGKVDNHPVSMIFPLAGTEDCLVLLGRVAGSPKVFENLVRCRPDGSIVWRAELPEPRGGEAYVHVSWCGAEIAANSWSGFKVILDPETGKIRSAKFTK